MYSKSMREINRERAARAWTNLVGDFSHSMNQKTLANAAINVVLAIGLVALFSFNGLVA